MESTAAALLRFWRERVLFMKSNGKSGEDKLFPCQTGLPNVFCGKRAEYNRRGSVISAFYIWKSMQRCVSRNRSQQPREFFSQTA